MRTETAEQAQKLDAPLDLDVLGRVRCDRALGDHQDLRRLVVRADGRGTVQLATGPGQQVQREPGGLAVVTVDPAAPGPVPTADEIRQALAETQRYPCRDERLQQFAREAVGNLTEPRARVQRLLAFVAAFVQDSYTDCDHPSVFAVIEHRTGDCSDHALLFTTLARALGIPARTVLGVEYQGDAVQAFGPHEWCEVVLDGRWVVVDPTFAQLPADAARLRLAADAVSAAVADFTLQVLQADR
jgi:transglutaminase-like putative cysteine protease